jgi:hypothetical protein
VTDRDRETRSIENRSIEIRRFRYRYEAEMAAGQLADAGIPAVVMGDDAGGMYPGIMPVALRVGDADAERAREVLGSSG